MTLQAVPDLAPDAGGPDAGGPVAGPAALAAAALRRSLTGSPGRLRVVGAVGILAVLLLAAVGTLAMQARAAALDTARADAEQLVRVQTLRTTLVQADADATNAYLTGGLEPPARRADYEASLARAAILVSEASRAKPSDAATLGQVNQVLVSYAGLVEGARASNRQGKPVGVAYLRQASALLRSDALPALSRIVDANATRVDGAYTASRNAAYQFWAAGMVAVGVLLWSQVWLARRSHRYFNLPIAATTVVILLVLMVCGLGMSAAQSTAQKVRDGSYATTAALVQARVSAFDAKSNESLTLISRGSGKVFETGAKSAYDDAAKQLSRTGLQSDFGLGAWVKVHQKIRALDDTGGFTGWDRAVAIATDAGPQDSNPTFLAFDQGSSQALKAAAARTSGELASARDSVWLESWLLLGAAVLAAIAVWWGISERLGEYR